MTKMAIVVVIALASFSMSAEQNSAAVSKSLVSLHDSRLDISPHGITGGSCISVQPDGQFHLEMRWQQLPNRLVTLHIYEGSLGDFQLQRLRALLDSQNIKDLDPYTPPVLPIVGLSAFASFEAHVARENQAQNVGYFVWDERVGKFDQSIPDSAKEQWRTGQTALIPLVQWFHEIEGIRWPEAPTSPVTFCGFAPPATN